MNIKEIHMDIGYKIKFYRNLKSLSQEKLAWQANITPSYLGQLERGLKSPTINTLEKISSALNISLVELFSSPITFTKDQQNALRQIEFQIRDLSSEDLYRLSNIIQNIMEIKG